VLEVESSNPRPAKFYTALQIVRHCFNIYVGRVAVLPWRYDMEMAPQIRCTLRRITTGIMKAFFSF